MLTKGLSPFSCGGYTLTMRWILGSGAKDLLLILGPGLLAVPFFRLLPPSFLLTVLAFLTFVVIDTGHVYTTVWRTYFRDEGRTSSRIYWVATLAIVLLMTPWFALGLPYAWSFVVYATMYHHFRQYYGMLRWYERLNGRACRVSEGLLYFLTIFPFVLMHFRPEPALQTMAMYAEHDVFLMQNPTVWRAGLWLLAAAWCGWLGFETSLWIDGKREPNRLLAVLCPSALACVCFLTGVDVVTLILPMLVNHGVPYFAVMTLSLNRIQPRRYSSLVWTAALIVGSATLFGLMEYGYENLVIDIDNRYTFRPIGFWQSALLGVYLVPLFCHYVLDAYIWTGKHREAKLVYGRTAAAPGVFAGAGRKGAASVSGRR